MSGAFLAHGIALAFAWFAAVNALLSAAVAGATGPLAHRRDFGAPSWLALRLLPSVGSTAFVVALFVPSYLRLEPRDGVEAFDVTLVLIAALGLAVLVAGGARGIRAWRRAARQADVWMGAARPFGMDAVGVPVYSIGSAPAPLMALVGVTAPRVFVSERLVDALTSDELSATLAHEASHAHAGDNLKRLAMRLAPDFLAWTAAGRAIERRWASAAEHSADRAGAGTDPDRRCALASALLKVARLTPAASASLDPISTLVGGGDIASRVERLLGDAPLPRIRRRHLRAAVVAAAVAVGAAGFTPALNAVHNATEILVHSLP